MNTMTKRFVFLLMVSVFFVSCMQDKDFNPEIPTITYLLHQAGYEPVRGKVEFKETGFGQIEIEITLINTVKDFDFPAHLHFGTISEVGELAMRLNDVNGNTGKSITILDKATLSSGELITLDLINEMNGSVKIHLSEGIFGHMVLAFGNIGANKNYFTDGMPICIGH